MTDGSGSSSLVYDDQGRVVTDTKVIGSETYPVAYSYDSNGLVTSITYPSGHVVTYVRAGDGKITGVTARPSSLGTPATIASGVTFAPFGPLTGLTYGNGLVLTHSYDRNYWLKGINVADGSTALLGLAFGRDGNGNLGSVTDTAGTARDAMYGYSDAARLSMSIGPWSASGPAYSEPSVVATTSNQVSAHYADGGPLPSDPHYTPGDSYSYAYDARQRLTGLKLNGSDIASYDYDHAGLRVIGSQLSDTPSTVHYIFAPDGKLLAEHDGATGDLIREYIWLDDMPLALVTGSVSTPDYHYVSTGQIGEPLMVTDATKAKVWDAAIDPWGRAVMLASPTTALDLRLPGQWYQGESGLHQNWMRDYDPTLGRYVEADPLGIEAGANLYGCVKGDPLNYGDPEGLQQSTPWKRPGIPFPIPGGAGQPDRNGNGFGDWDEQGGKKIKEFWDACVALFGRSCPPCQTVSGKIVPVGTVGYRFDKVPPSRPHYPFPGDHYNLLVAHQNPNTCQCFWRPLKQASVNAPPGSIPVEPFIN